MPNARFLLVLGLAGCASSIALPDALPAQSPMPPQLAAVRARGPAALEEMLAKYDAMPASTERDAFALEIDRVAAQRYATTSRLYWYTDYAQAKAAAAESHKPILALRMLGRLDEDLSCANSRLFRATLYSDPAVSQFLKDNFVLYWSSERAVPKVTIDFGDGRKIESTTTGNSAHYVLDESGAVVDVLPGLYAPRAFRAELVQSLAQAHAVAAAAPAQRDDVRRAYHRAQAQAMTVLVDRIGPSVAIAAAQETTITKMYIERPVLRQITGKQALDALGDNDIAQWISLAYQTWPYLQGQPVLSLQAMDLVTRIHTANDRTVTKADQAAIVARLQQTILADSALDQLRLRPRIHQQLAEGLGPDFSTVNQFVYAKVFHTPASDPWLGLLPRTDFTGVPGDGVTTAQR